MMREALKGSSPLARGPRDAVALRCKQQGLIPARAGTTVEGLDRL